MRALGMLFALILITTPVHAVSAQYYEPDATWPVVIGSILFIAAIIFCVVAMRRIVNGNSQNVQEARVVSNEG